MFTLKDLQEKVEKRISDYIEFDVKEVFQQSDYITIYGGAVRDSLAGLEIHDIDILCMPNSANKLRTFLIRNGYEPLDLYDPDVIDMYRGITLISEPWTLMNKNRKIIQIIRPRWNGQMFMNKPKDYVNITNTREYQLAYYNLIKNVDISCCGVFLENHDREIRLREACKNAILSCLSQTYEINNWSQLYNTTRTSMREYKLTSRGWFNIKSINPLSVYKSKNVIKKERLYKIYSLEFNPEYDYKIWTEEEYLNKPKPEKTDDFWTIEDL